MILVDDRIGSRHLVDYLKGSSLTRLEFGDACFFGNGPKGEPISIGIELKVVDDVLACITDGRFAGHQLPGLVNTYDIVYLVMEGRCRANPKDGTLEQPYKKGWSRKYHGRPYMWRDLQHWLMTMEFKAGIRFRNTFDRKETALFIKTLYSWWNSKEWEEHRAHLAFDVSSRSSLLLKKPSLLRRIAKELPGIGWSRSGAVDKHFSSVREMCCATAYEWIKIEGVGKVLAKGVSDAIASRK